MSLEKQFNLHTKHHNIEQVSQARRVAGLDSDAPGLRSATQNWASGEQAVTHQEEEGTVLPGGHPLRPVPNVRGKEVTYQNTEAEDIFRRDK